MKTHSLLKTGLKGLTNEIIEKYRLFKNFYKQLPVHTTIHYILASVSIDANSNNNTLL